MGKKYPAVGELYRSLDGGWFVQVEMILTQSGAVPADAGRVVVRVRIVSAPKEKAEANGQECDFELDWFNDRFVETKEIKVRDLRRSTVWEQFVRDVKPEKPKPVESIRAIKFRKRNSDA